MRAGFNEPALVDDEDFAGVANGGEAVGDDEAGALLHEAVHGALDVGFGVGVDGGGSFIENQNRRLGHKGAGDAEELALAL